MCQPLCIQLLTLTAHPCHIHLQQQVASLDGGSAVEPLRQLVGPADPEIARTLRPASLRARFGHSKVRNGVHCTDLAEDGELEAGFVFGSDWVR